MKKVGKKFSGGIQSVLMARLALVLLILSIARFLLYVFNTELFAPASIGDLISAYFVGWRFDLVTLAIFSSLLIVGNTLPLPFRKNAIYQKTLNGISLFAFSIAIVLNCVDVVYYRFTLKRMTFDIFSYLENNGGFLELIPSFLTDFWLIGLLTLLLLFLLIYLFGKINLDKKKENISWKYFAKNTAYFLLWAGLIILGIRGGTQLIPLGIVDASLHTKTRLVPIVLNSPFTIIKSYGQEGLTELNYYSDEEVKEIFNPIRSYSTPIENSPNSIENVVIIVLESISSEHIGYLSNKKTFTPFLDSLFEKSLVFKGTANGKRSIEGIPAILSSLPTLSNESFLNGPYAMNQIEGLAATLSKRGYQTAFFHGGKNGTMSFDAYAKSAGFESYYGLNEYPNKDDYDGNWGIWDEEYLAYFASTLSTFNEPFFATVFTLSSHHPYSIPQKYKGVFEKGKIEIQQTISYTDLALRKYFEKIKMEEWYDRTLFIITADHTSEGASEEYRNSLGQYSIPIAFFAPGDSLLPYRSKRQPVQQSDILPSIVDYLGFNDSIICFGNSVFSELEHPFVVNYSNNTFQILDSTYMLRMEGEKALGLYRYKEDSLLVKNLIDTTNFEDLLNLQKAFSQQYTNRMIQNRLKIQSNE